MAIPRPSGLIGGRRGPVAPRALKVIHEALGEPEGAARQSARVR